MQINNVPKPTLLRPSAVAPLVYSVSPRPLTLLRAEPSTRRAGKIVCSSVTGREQLVTQNDEDKQLKQGIAQFYDESSGLWEEIWGEHMHHGYYPAGASVPVSNQQAQVDMIEAVLAWAEVDTVKKMVDVGCGIGGSSRYIACKYGGEATGITLSPVQAARANELSIQQGLSDRVSFRVGDALNQPFASGEFDLVWSLESGEHMPDKTKFVGELARVAAPNGRIIVVTWCHRVLEDGETQLTPEEQSLLDRICAAYYLPAWCSIEDYRKLFIQNGLTDIKTADWSTEVSPFWGAVIQSALTPQGVMGLMKAGWNTLRGAMVMPLMAEGFKRGLIKFNCITAVKPSQ